MAVKCIYVYLALLLFAGTQLATSQPAYASAGAYYPNRAAAGQGYYPTNQYPVPQYNSFQNGYPQFNTFPAPQFNPYPSGPVPAFNPFPNQAVSIENLIRSIQEQNLRLQQQIAQLQQSLLDQNNQVDSRFGDVSGGYSPNGPVSASASASFGPQGGFLTGSISPTGPNIMSRFAETLPPSSGNSIGVFSSSSSSSFTGPNGKQVSRKTATSGVNDNGKVTIKTVHDP